MGSICSLRDHSFPSPLVKGISRAELIRRQKLNYPRALHLQRQCSSIPTIAPDSQTKNSNSSLGLNHVQLLRIELCPTKFLC